MRLVLIALTVGLAIWLPHAEVNLEVQPLPESVAAATWPTAVLSSSPGRYGAMQHGRTPLPPKAIALTFDDGPDAGLNTQVLDILDARGIKATFFLVGQYASQNPGRVREIVRRGHNVASHSWSHPTTLRHWSREAQVREVRRGFGALESALADAPVEQRARLEPMFRFPGLNEGAYLTDWLNTRGVIVVSAEGGSDDWKGLSSPAIHARAVRSMKAAQGGVLILHETRPMMVAALPGLLDDLTSQGFTFVQITAGPEGRTRALGVEDSLFTAR